MATVTLSGRGWSFPDLPQLWNTAQILDGTSTAFVFSATVTRAYIICRVNRALDNITKVAFLVASCTTKGAGDCQVSIQGVSSGNPDGTIKGGGNCKKTFTPTQGVSNQYFDLTLDAGSGSLAENDTIAIVWQTVGDATDYALTFSTIQGDTSQLGNLYGANYAGSWGTKSGLNFTGVFGLIGQKDSVDYALKIGCLCPFSGTTSLSWDSGTTITEAGARITAPVNGYVNGFWLLIDPNQYGEFILYNASGTALKTIAHDATYQGSSNGGTMFFRWDTGIQVDKDAVYYVFFKPSTTSPDPVMYYSDIDSDYVSIIPAGGNVVYGKKESGTISADTTKFVYAGLIYSSIVTGGGTYVY